MPEKEAFTMTMIVDRIEEDLAVIEETDDTGDVTLRKLPLDWLPAEIEEGDVIRKTKSGYVIDRTETQKRRQAASALLQSLTEVE
jgi:hypothetical protein